MVTTTILGIFGKILGYAVTVVILALVGRFVFDVCVSCLETAWYYIHKPSLDKFKAKMAERKARKKADKKENDINE